MLKTRVITALALLAVLVPALIFLPSFWWALFVLVAVTTGAWEWGRLAQLSPGASYFYALLVGGAGLAILLHGRDPYVDIPLGLAALLAWVAALGWMRWPSGLPRGWALALLGAVMLLACWRAVWEAHLAGPLYLFLLMGVVWVADIGAYFAGRRFGRHKLAPSISPGKTWEGVVGGVTAVLLLALITVQLPVGQVNYFQSLHASSGWVVTVVVAVLLAFTSVVGDLFESLLKRRAGMKDSSALLPGHGGVLDRIDALIPAIPLAMAIGALAGRF
jgi:phosphatidate cytidylyltransferase